ncbi:hypothetical protein FLACOL_02066 [Flavobacterium columnare]|uniref:Uncharacterized protein n=2 Tax=Flavobacterium TaxID=237 RepID=A0A2N9PCG3_9FLAO|nr:hypothetical protein [Flavobacterium columnare]RVU92099.1 hypothetical protein EH230_00930 [Flavobacterium columnare]SPE78052.1 hypothetical protein FLACOL_02066 [Flavobacterium columnare]
MKSKLLQFALFSSFGILSLFSCEKDNASAPIVNPTIQNEFIGTWDKQDTVRISFTQDGKFTAQRWIGYDKSYANNFAVEGEYITTNGEVTINVKKSNLAHLWSNQKLEKIILKTELASDKQTVKVKSVTIYPTNLDVKDAVIKRLSNSFKKNLDPKTALPIELLTLTDIATYQPINLPNIKPWTYKTGEFNFTFNNYQLGIPTTDQTTVNLPFSPMGQHLHLIIDDAPYLGVSSNPFKYNLADGEHTIAIAPGRSYHEIYKNPEAIITTKSTIMNGDEILRVNISNQPHIFASRPRGTYSLTDAKKLLIDYILTEASKINIDSKKYTVRITINQTPFLNEKWVPKVLEGLARLGTHQLILDLYDLENKKIISTKKSEFFIQ